MRLVVGLGNPDERYIHTRHNVGWMVLAELRRRHDFGRPRGGFHSRVWSGSVGGQSVMLVQPQTYMNRSGLAVAELVAFYRPPESELLVVLDDMALPCGRLRARAEGSAGGHNGLSDIVRALGSLEVARVRVGIGQAPPQMDWADYVLSGFSPQEQPVMEQAIRRAADAVTDWIAQGITYVMDKYNQDPQTGSSPGQDGPGENGKGK